MRTAMLGASALAGFAIASTAALASEKSFDFKDFDSVSVSAGVQTTITAGGDYSVVAESTDDGLDRLEIKQNGSELKIGRKMQFMNWGRQPRLKVTVSMPALVGLDVSSGSDTTATGVAGGDFKIDASSGANAKVSGVCNALELDISSGADVDARELKCKSATADASSGGDADIFASESVNADASSGGHVAVHGKPANVTVDKSSGGSVSVVD